MHKYSVALVVLGVFPLLLLAQPHFADRTALLTPVHHQNGIAVAIADMNGDGRDDIVRLDQGYRLSVEYQTAPGQSFLHKPAGPVSDDTQWGICIADIDQNGRPDILTAGVYDGIKTLLAKADGSGFQLVRYDAPSIFAQAANFADLDGDGWPDAFICNDDGTSVVLRNTADGTGNLVYYPQILPLNTVPPSDNSGNYGSVWCDVDGNGAPDLYISKCKGGVTDPADGRRLNQLFLNQGAGVFIQDTLNASGLRIGAQSWAADFGDFDNDGDFDCFLINHYESCQLLENDGAGHFTDITAAAGLQDSVQGFAIQTAFRDFDNDGFVDILVAGSRHVLLHNNGDKTFSRLSILDDKQMPTFALGDLNADGFQDIYAAYSGFVPKFDSPFDALWLNTGNTNHFFGLNLRGASGNRDAIGAKVLLYNALGIQVREVRSGESYGIMNSMQIHFGLGQHTAIDSAVIRWPSGAREVLYHPMPDQYMTVEEGRCAVAQPRIQAAGSTVFCSGDSVILSSTELFTGYKWSTGDTAAALTVKTGGIYDLTVTVAGGCTAVSNAISVITDPVETPGITLLAGDTVLCAGSMATLAVSPAQPCLWSTGDTTPVITTGEAGAYTVQIQGLCAAFSSDPVHITVLNPEPPAVIPDTVAPGTPATLGADGFRPVWYEAADGGVPVGFGHTFVTPPLDASTTYWVADSVLFPSPGRITGMADHEGTPFSGPQTEGWLVFDCWTPVKLLRVKVYTDTAGPRKIDLRDSGGAVLQSALIDIPAGTSTLDLHFDIPAGTNLRLATDTAVNRQTFGFAGPRLQRSDQNTAFPYTVPGYLSIKSTNLGPYYYFYFYNWEIEPLPKECLSERVPVTARVDSTLSVKTGMLNAENLRLYPNPSAGAFRVIWPSFPGGDLQLCLRSTSGAVVWLREHHALPQGLLDTGMDAGALPSGAYWLELSTREGMVRKFVALH